MGKCETNTMRSGFLRFLFLFFAFLLFVNADSVPPSINFTDPTLPDGGVVQGDWLAVNVSVSDADYCSAFVDFNRTLAGYWSFNDGTASDSSGLGLNGALVGGVDCSVQGRFGKACSFDGVSGYVNLSAERILTFPGSHSVSLEAWVKPEFSGDEQIILSKYNRYVKGEYRLGINASGHAYAMREVSPWSIETVTPLSPAQWHHLVYVFNGQTLFLYVDGMLSASGGFGNTAGDSQSPFLIGAWLNRSVAGNFFKGVIDEVRVWNRSLSVEEVNASFNAGSYRLFRNFTNLPRGSVSFQAVAVDADGNVNKTESRNVYVNKTLKPIAHAGADQLALVGNPVVLNASRSRDPDGSITLYQWDFDNDGVFDYTGQDPIVTHDFSAEGRYTPTLTVFDNEGLNSTAKALVVVKKARQPNVRDITDNLLSYPDGKVPLFEKFELNFNVDSIAENPFWPFDENPTPPNAIPAKMGVSVDGLFSNDSWQTTLVQPAFYFVDFEHGSATGGMLGGGLFNWLYPTSREHWAIRFAPTSIGNWKYKIRITDAAGSFESSEYSFECVNGSSHGFVRVSPTDKRYFKYSDGTYANFIGATDAPIQMFPNLSLMGLNIIRPWWQGSYGPVLFGISGQGGVSEWGFSMGTGNIAYGSEFTRPGELFSIKATNTSSPAISAFVKTGANYQLSAWVKTVDINGTGDYGVYLAPYPPRTSSSQLIYKSELLKGTNDWKFLTVNFTMDSSGNKTSLKFYFQKVLSGQIYFTDLSLKEDFGNGEFGPELVSKPSLNVHRFVSQQQAFVADYQVEEAKKYDIYLKVIIEEKQDMIYNRIQSDGTAGSPSDNNVYGWNSYAGRTYQKYYWRYFIARYGYSTNIHSIEYCNEGDPYNGMHWSAVNALGVFVKENDPNKHLVVTSNWHSFPAPLWVNPNLDYADLHVYTGFGVYGTGCRVIAGWDGPWYDMSRCVNASNLGRGFEFDSTQAHSGENSLKMTLFPHPGDVGNTANWVDSRLSFQSGLIPGNTYELSYWIKGENVRPGSGCCWKCGPSISAYFDTGGSNWIGWPPGPNCGRLTSLQNGSFDWTRVSQKFVAPKNGTSITGSAYFLGISIMNPGNNDPNQGIAWIDDVEVRDLNTSEVQNFNGGFEYLEPESYDVVANHQAYSKLTHSFHYGKPTIRGETGLWAPTRFCEFQNGTPRADWKWCYYKGFSTDADQLLIDDLQGIWWKKWVWAHMDSGALIDLMWGSRDILYARQFKYGKAFQNFMADTPLSNGFYEDINATVSNPQLRVLGQRDLVNKRAHLWIDNRRHTWKNVVDKVSIPVASGVVEITGFGNESYRLEWWNTTTSSIEQSEVKNASNGTISFSIANLASDLALKVYLTTEAIINVSCGDGVCYISENCSSCPVDCGACPCTNCGGGGGGGGLPSGGTGGGVASQTTSSLSTSTSLSITSTTQECTSGESKCVESSAGNFLFQCVGGAWKTQKECRVGCTKLGVGGECRRESNETLANAYSRALAEVNSLLADAKAAGLNISAEELDLRKASEFKNAKNYLSAVEVLEKTKKSLQEKLAKLPTQQLLELSQQRVIGLTGAALALIFLAYFYIKRKQKEKQLTVTGSGEREGSSVEW
ncbi:PKD domain-containing protein [Candidatus Micrarchaeota archaeon]|nr:PKD domain-containing protein [Candidatus Micrarchaeota archaeon]